MDNLFNSRKLYSAAYACGALCHGVTRTNGRGVPPEVVQKVEPDMKKSKLLHGTTKCAVLVDDPLCPDLLCCSIYDTKPVHFLSTCATQVDWKEMIRDVFDSAARKTVPMKYLRLNLIHSYNNHMNSVDLADQLRNCYRFNHWFRNRKWWWSIFLWAVGVAATNAYIIYDRLYEEEKKKNRPMPAKWDHMHFLQELISDFVGWKSYAAAAGDDNTTAGDSSIAATTRRGSSYSSVPSHHQTFFDLTTEEGRQEFVELVRPTQVNKHRMGGAYFSCRLNGGEHHSMPVRQPNAYCQYCKYKWNEMDECDKANNMDMKQNRGVEIQRCLTCNVNLCWKCRITWHNVSLDALSADVSRRFG